MAWPQAQSILLSIGDDGVVVVPHGIAEASPFFMTNENSAAAADIASFVERHSKAEVILFADNLGQDYRIDTLPRLNFIDRARLAKRRLRQHYPTAPLATCLHVKASRYLMIGLHESSAVFYWAERLKARLPRIALLPYEAARMLVRLVPEARQGWTMMISRHESGGFRQIVTCDGTLVFTRLTPLPDRHDDDQKTISRDIKASLDYLTRHGLQTPRDLRIILLSAGPHQAHDFHFLQVGSVACLSPFQAAQRLKLPFAADPDDSAGDLLFAGYLLASPNRALFLRMPAALQAARAQRVSRCGMVMASCALLFALLHVVGQAKTLVETLGQVRQQTQIYDTTNRQLAEAQQQAAPLTQPLGRMRQAVERQRIYTGAPVLPWAVMQAAAEGMQGSAARLIKLDWLRAGADPEQIGLTFRMRTPDAANDRAATVDAFNGAMQKLAAALPAYQIVKLDPPYPSLPSEAVHTENENKNDDAIGSILLRATPP